MGRWDGWRRVQEFPNYQINSEGEVRNQRTFTILTEQQNKSTGAWFYAMDKEGKTYSRAYKPMLYKAWPELLEAWKPIPGLPDYLIDRDGKVMGTLKYLEIGIDKHTGKSYILRSNGERKTFKLLDFDWTVFDNYEEIKWYQMAQERDEAKRKREEAKKGDPSKWRSVMFLPSHEINSDGVIRNKNTYRKMVVKEYFPLEHPGVLFVRISPQGPHGTKTYLRYDNILNDAWPELEMKEAA